MTTVTTMTRNASTHTLCSERTYRHLFWFRARNDMMLGKSSCIRATCLGYIFHTQSSRKHTNFHASAYICINTHLVVSVTTIYTDEYSPQCHVSLWYGNITNEFHFIYRKSTWKLYYFDLSGRATNVAHRFPSTRGATPTHMEAYNSMIALRHLNRTDHQHGIIFGQTTIGCWCLFVLAS